MVKNIILLLSLAAGAMPVLSQSNITFRHLSTENGLSYVGVVDMCTDKKGNLWIGTGNGLNMFNGKTVERYFATENPELQNNNIVHVACDSHNRVWVLTANGNVTIIDEKRNFHRVGLYDQNKFVKTRWINETQKGNLLLFTAKGHYSLTPDVKLTELDSITIDQLIPLAIEHFDTLQPKYYKQVFYYDDDHYLFVMENEFYKVDYRNRQVENKYIIPHCTALTKLNEDELLVYDRNSKEVKIIDLRTSKISLPFKNLSDQYGRPITAIFKFAEKVKDDQYILTTQASGIYIYDHATKKIYHHTHHFADKSSISTNITNTLEVSSSGWVFIDCNPGGISYYNSNEIVSNQHLFIDQYGTGYDGYIAGIATKDNNTFYMGTTEGLLEWNRSTNTSHFLRYKDENGEPLLHSQEITSVTIDQYDQVWTTTVDQGLMVISKDRKLKRQIPYAGKGKNSIKLERANRLINGPDRFVWACGKNGICRINPRTFEVDNFENTILSTFDSLYCTIVMFTDADNLWTSLSSGGVVHCNLATNEVQKYTTNEGLINNGIFSLGADRSNNVYVGTRAGLTILFANGRMKNLTQKDGLLMDRAEALLLDKHNRMWIGNDIGLACYTPSDSSLVTFDTRHGLSIYGFRVGSYIQTPGGEFVFGTPKGIQYFHPDSLFNKKISLNALIYKIETRNIDTHIDDDAVFHLTSGDRQVNFYFSTVEYSPHVRTYYQYQLAGLDDDWIPLADQNSVRYNSLPAGDYVFKVRISNDNKHWQNAENEVSIVIADPFYQQWWFRLAGLCMIFGVIYLISKMISRRERERTEELETEAVINYFASRINRHQTTDELLWDVVENCISKLQFEDCVIYLIDPERRVLVQKAAYGPKSATDYTIHHPLDIPVGDGIVGSVAQSGRAELIGDTSKDPRYIVDDKMRLSELCVPLIMEGNVIGVIDSEHSRKNFFTQKHLSILTTIAVLCVNQIQRNQAEAEKQQTKIELIENKQKATESQTSEPAFADESHFLFNALNSIQQMILANEEMVATRYLSRFQNC